jgi:hypothetical protein
MIVRPWLAFALGLVLCHAVPASASEDPKGFTCTFKDGATHVYEKGAFNAEVPTPLSFGIEGIDQSAQTAELKTERGTGSLKLVLAVNATHFIELVTEGSLHITTIFDKDEAKGAYPAVHSRHFGLMGQPIVTQYQGFCQAKT